LIHVKRDLAQVKFEETQTWLQPTLRKAETFLNSFITA